MPPQTPPETIEAGRAKDLDMARRLVERAEAAMAVDGATRTARRRIGPSIPGYELLRQVGSGGQGVVYEAVHTATGRRVAIKVLAEVQAGRDAARLRFDRELLLSNRVEHPGIVAIRDRLEVDGRIVHVMDFVEGIPFDEFIEQHRLDVEGVLELMAKVCEAVGAAHLRGVIHRDLKPGNVLVDDQGQPHVVDFGLAKADDGPDAGPARRLATITQTGQFLGTLAWTSPEQAEGQGHHVDVRSDVYALGVMLYHGLTGAFPYPVDGPLRETLEHVVHTPPVPPRRRNRRIDRDTDTIVLTCLQKDPGRRYQSAVDLARDLRRRLEGRPIAARGDSTVYMVGKLVSRHRVAVALGLAAVVAAVAGLSTLWVLQAQKQREAARANTLLAVMVDDIFGRVADVRDDGRDARMSTVLHAAARSIDAKGYDPLVEQFVRRVLAMGFRSIGLLDDAMAEVNTAEAICASRLRPSHPDVLAVRLEKARVLMAIGDEAAIVAQREKAAEAWAAALGELDGAIQHSGGDLRTGALAMEFRESRAHALRRLGRHDEAVQKFRGLVADWERLASAGGLAESSGAASLRRIESLAGLADALEARWQATGAEADLSEAQATCRMVLEGLQAMEPSDEVRIATAKSSLADKLAHSGNQEEVARLRAEAKEGFASYRDPESVMLRRIHDSLIQYLERMEGPEKSP